MSTLYHSLINLQGGIQQGIDSSLHQPSEYELAVNCSCRGGLIQTRQALESIGVVVPAGLYQGGFLYRYTDANYLVFVIAGEIHLLDVDTRVWLSLGVLLDVASDKVYFCQANRFLIIQDNVFPVTWAAKNWPVLLDGAALFDQSASRLATPHQATPKGGPMAYGQGRLFVASPYIFNGTAPTDNIGMKGFVAGDIVKAYAPEELLDFTENIYLDEGGQIILPHECGEVRAMSFQRNVVSGTGQGPLVVGAEYGFAQYAVNAPRSEWNDIDFGQILFSGIGTRSNRAISNINGDLLFRATDSSIRTLIQTNQMQQTGFLSKQSLSASVYKIVQNDNISTLGKCSAVIHGARHLSTVLPGDTNGTFSGVLSLDMLPVAALSTQTSPIWESVWTGLEALECLEGIEEDEDTGLVVADDSDGIRRIYRPQADELASDEDAQIEAWLVTSCLNANDPFMFKKFKYASLWISQVKSNCAITIYYRADRSSLWAKTSTSTILFDGTNAQNRRCLRFTPTEPVPVQKPSGILMTNGFTHQFAIGWTGRLRIERARFMFESQTEDYDVAKTEQEAVEFVVSSGLFDLDFYDYRRTP